MNDPIRMKYKDDIIEATLFEGYPILGMWPLPLPFI